MTLLHETLSIALAAAPWLLLGLLAAGLVKAFIPETMLQRWLGGRGIGAVSRAAVIGAPLPLCSCGAIPTAIALHRGGAGRGPTTAFLIGTPGIGVDSVAISYALLGPFMMAARVLGAVTTAIATGLLVGNARDTETRCPGATQDDCCSGGCDAAAPGHNEPPMRTRLAGGLRYAFSDVLDDISVWLLAGLVVAGLLITFVPPQALAAYGSGLPAMLLMALVGVPMYLCATAATPVAVGLILAGVSPGTALVFLLAGPITSMATLGVLRREMGNGVLVRYLGGIVVCTVTAGMLVDFAIARTGLDVAAQLGAARELLPPWLEAGALVVLVMLAIRPVRRRFIIAGAAITESR
ncbi:hypothetical protein B1C78_13050 [Thioalkalivibrio denitrificans]|uniref:Permease n=1 Tax=Thioalkalivibrio denitrificans TaxID=108003 RepID=A0A1V3NDM3_9GAMM|nr:SO_0444 family Cu/Zn efflux transporter [Thioalkalivibrio denitrificans]OOG22978.1 hypothetical protein B1C78_13050 [Thioalkalivibrio denitrificans]